MRGSVWRFPGIRELVWLSLAGFSGYAALLATAPAWVLRGGANEAGAGLVTFVLLAATVATQFAVPGWLGRWGHGPVLAAALVLIGAPAPAYLLSDALPPVLLVSAVRGVGFGILTVTGAAVVAHLVPAGRRGEAIGIYGLAVATPMVLVLPGSVALTAAHGFGWACLLGLLPLLGVPAAFALARHLGPQEEAETLADEAPPDRRTWLAVLRPTLVLTSVTMAGGALQTFLPEVAPSGGVGALAILLLGVVSALCRWGAGGLADRRGAASFLVPLLLCGGAGLALCAWSAGRGGDTVLLIAGVGVAAVAYGALQNLTLVLAFEAAPPGAIPAASAAWNVGFDAGTAVGAAAAGAVAATWSFTVAFAVLAAVCLLAVPLGARR